MFGTMSTPLPRRICWHVSRLGVGWRIEVVHVSSGVVRERVRGRRREDARRRRRGRVTLDPTSSPCVRARRVKFGPCTVSGARKIEDFEKTRIMSTRKRDQDPWHRDFQSCREGGRGGACFSMARRALMCCKMDVAAEQRPEGIQDMGTGSGGAMQKKIGWRCWWKVVVTIKPKRAEELRPASLAEPAPFMTPPSEPP